MNEFLREKFERDFYDLVRRYSDKKDKRLETHRDIVNEAKALLRKTANYGKPKPCCSCGKLMEPIGGDWSGLQPVHGCEIKIYGSYGSRHDLKEFQGIICDDCVEKLDIQGEEYI